MQSRVAVVLLVVVGLLAACKKPTASPPAGRAPIAGSSDASSSSDAAFWQWFAANKDEVAKVKRADEPMADQLAAHLHAIDGGLTFELGVATTQHELIVSAAGIKSLFPVVKRVVAAAPPLPGWKIIAFRQRNSGFSVELGDGTKLGGDAITFLPRLECGEDGRRAEVNASPSTEIARF